jgi:hypothetical protein
MTEFFTFFGIGDSKEFENDVELVRQGREDVVTSRIARQYISARKSQAVIKGITWGMAPSMVDDVATMDIKVRTYIKDLREAVKSGARSGSGMFERFIYRIVIIDGLSRMYIAAATDHSPGYVPLFSLGKDGFKKLSGAEKKQAYKEISAKE